MRPVPERLQKPESVGKGKGRDAMPQTYQSFNQCNRPTAMSHPLAANSVKNLHEDGLCVQTESRCGGILLSVCGIYSSSRRVLQEPFRSNALNTNESLTEF